VTDATPKMMMMKYQFSHAGKLLMRKEIRRRIGDRLCRCFQALDRRHEDHAACPVDVERRRRRNAQLCAVQQGARLGGCAVPLSGGIQCRLLNELFLP